MPLPPPLKSSAAIRAASTEPMPLVSWKMPEMSLSTPTRTTLSEISARAAPHVAHDKASARPNLQTFIVFALWNLNWETFEAAQRVVVAALHRAGDLD